MKESQGVSSSLWRLLPPLHFYQPSSTQSLSRLIFLGKCKSGHHIVLLQVVVVVILLVSCTMASLLSVLSTLRLLAVPHDIYYIHYGLASLMCSLYSGLLACGLIAGLASLTLLTVTCLGLPFCTTHNQVGPLGQKKEGQDGKVGASGSANNNGGWRQTL